MEVGFYRAWPQGNSYFDEYDQRRAVRPTGGRVSEGRAGLCVGAGVRTTGGCRRGQAFLSSLGVQTPNAHGPPAAV